MSDGDTQAPANGGGKGEGTLTRPLEVNQFPFAVEEIENEWIPLPDGTRLAARIWMPQDASAEPVPAILEYLPYRKRDGTSTRDELTHPYFAGHGYACVRVDIRGSGESDGLMDDEYDQSEQDDALGVIDWLVAQPWCNGRVGMMGISWGGFNGLQVAWCQPDALKAVITICSTDDRYADDIHYKGGNLLNENQGWGATMLAYQSRPPDKMLLESWRERWMERLENMPLLAHRWLTHQRRDAYWQHGSVCEDFSRINAAVLTVGGWGDAYSNAVPRLRAGIGGATRAIIGPWLHKYPHFAVPQPAIGFLQEALRWWDQWLKDVDTGVAGDAKYRVYVMDAVRPSGWYTQRPGAWYELEVWPEAATAQTVWHLGHQHLSREPQAARVESTRVCSPVTTGQASGEYCAIWLGPEMPTDQRIDDAGSAVFDSAPLEADLPLLGAAVLELALSCDQPQAQLAVRLCDVWPDGASTRITYGVLNLTHRDGHEQPTSLEPGVQYRVRIALDDVGYVLPAGHRLRLAVSNAYWPLIWPSPQRATVTLNLRESTLTTPTLPSDAMAVTPFEQPVSSPAQAKTILRPDTHERTVTTDLATGVQTLRIVDDFGASRIDALGLVNESVARETYTIAADEPTSARCDTHWTEVVAREDWRIRTETFISQTCDGYNFYISARLEAYEDEQLVFEREWDETVKRDGV
jgi:putative CocE/NonD family hydrolase